MDWTDSLVLPPGTHAAVLTGHDIVDGGDLAYPVVWADRVSGDCSRCGEPTARVIEDCPVLLNTGAGQGGAIQEWSKQHGCGEWLSVDWAEVQPGDPAGVVTGDDVVAAARVLAARLAGEITAGRERICKHLAAGLRSALRRLAEPLEEGETRQDREDEVRTGSDIEPGVYQENGEWLAWDYDLPSAGDSDDIDSTADTITVHASDLAAEGSRD